jgi:hypothetical protein
VFGIFSPKSSSVGTTTASTQGRELDTFGCTFYESDLNLQYRLENKKRQNFQGGVANPNRCVDVQQSMERLD